MDIFNHLIDSVLVESTVSDNMGHQQLHTEYSVSGNGMDVYDNQHHLVTHIEQNVFGGETNYDAQHNMQGYTTHNVFGGTDMHNQLGAVVSHSQPNIFGGSDFHNNMGQTVASTKYQAGSNSEQWNVGDSSFQSQLANEFHDKFWRS